MASEDDGWEDDDEMADLFSFGNDAAGVAPAPVAAPPVTTTTTTTTPTLTRAAQIVPERVASNDSILDMLQGDETPPSVLTDDSSAVGTTTATTTITMKEQDAQDILNWLDEEDTTSTMPDAAMISMETAPVTKPEDSHVEEESVNEVVSTELPRVGKAHDEEKHEFQAEPTIVAIPPPPPLVLKPKEPPIHFESLEDALESPKATLDDLRSLFVNGGMKVSPERRAHLWCRTVCHKTLEDVMSSSLADSFLKWQETTNLSELHDARSVYVQKEANILAERIVAGTSNSHTTHEQAERALCEVLLFHYQSSSPSSTSSANPQKEVDPLLPPVACTLLSAGVPPAAASVMLASIMPTFMPLLALTQEERWEAAKLLHTQFYFLAAYHLPLLVFHLDRYAPGWYWPKVLSLSSLSLGQESSEENNVTHRNRNLQSHGYVPQSWLISHLAGECGGTLMNPMWLLSLWDLILTSSNNSLRFFLALAILDKNSDILLQLVGDDLIEELKRIMEFKDGTTLEGFAIVAEEETTECEAGSWVQEWCDRARALWEATPRSVVSQLRTAEDEAVLKALTERQKRAEEELQARLEAEARAYRMAQEAEKERKAEEARIRLSRARLVAYYRTHNPEKEGNIDKIMQVYEGRLDVLDDKLKTKYGVGFKPALKPKPMSKTQSKILSTMNAGLGGHRLASAQAPTNETKEPQLGDPEHRVTVKVLATEVLPVICWSKEAAASRSPTALARGRYSDDFRVPLKFYLVDARPEKMTQEQGRFPTAIPMSPEALLDPDHIQQHEEMFESLRGAVHICIMGEGFSAMSRLYGHKVTQKVQQAMDDDESRTNLCALFFVKKGFPFVSILDGGFIQAHAWLCREGPKSHLDATSVLVDYDEDNSFLARLERQYKTQQELANASAREKTQRVLQSLLDSSMVTLTKKAMQVESMATGIETQDGMHSIRESVTKLLPKHGAEEALFVGDSAVEHMAPIEDAEETPVEGNFVNRFSSIRNAAVSIRKADGERNEYTEGDFIVAEQSTPTHADGSEPKFKISFAGFRSAADNLRKSEAATGVAGEEEGDTEADTPSTTGSMFRIPFGARRGAVAEKVEAEDTEATDEKEAVKGDVDESDLEDVSFAPVEAVKPSAFARFAKSAGISIQKGSEQVSKSASSSIQKTDEQNASQTAPKRNPFSRFGAAPPESEGTKPNRFGGINMMNMNQLRLSTLTNLRAKAADEEEAHTDVEESISFDTAPADSSAAGDQEKAKESSKVAVVESV